MNIDFVISVLKVFAVLFILGVVWMYWTRLRGAPWVTTPLKVVHKMLSLAHVGSDDLVYDLGSGDGRIIFTAARKFGARAVGIEIDPLRYLWTQALIRLFGLRGQVQVIFGDFFTQDLSQADVVTVFLQPDTNEKLTLKFVEELRPGTRVVSYKSTFSIWSLVEKDHEELIYLYNVGKVD